MAVALPISAGVKVTKAGWPASRALMAPLRRGISTMATPFLYQVQGGTSSLDLGPRLLQVHRGGVEQLLDRERPPQQLLFVRVADQQLDPLAIRPEPVGQRVAPDEVRQAQPGLVFRAGRCARAGAPQVEVLGG